jgi:hypothetical protein
MKLRKLINENEKIDFGNGCWWGLIKNGELIAVKFSSKQQPASYDFNISLSSINTYDVIPVIIKADNY